MKILFREIKKLKRGEPIDSRANGDVKKVIAEFIKDADVLDMFKLVEEMKWYGVLEYPEDKPEYFFTFRNGVCQCFTRGIVKGKARFKLNKINEAVDFGNGKDHERK